MSSVLALTMGMSAGTSQASDTLDEVRALYASAAYEDTLALLGRVDDPAVQDAADEYRALCFLALNREAAAEEAISAMVRRRPNAPVDLSTRAPKFVALYKNVRGRMLPTLATTAYTTAKATLEAGDVALAAKQFRDALALLRAARESSAGVPPAADFEVLASGFLSLAERQLAQARAAAAPQEPPALMVHGAAGLSTAFRSAPAPVLTVDLPTSASTAPSAVGAPTAGSVPFTPVPRVFDATDIDVTPPVIIDQKLPRWMPPHAMLRTRRFTGRVEVVVDVEGRVMSAEILKPSFSMYDDQVLEAAKQWLYWPAKKREYPVRYRRVIDYVLREADERSAR